MRIVRIRAYLSVPNIDWINLQRQGGTIAEKRKSVASSKFRTDERLVSFRSTRFLRSMFESNVSFDPALPVVVFLYASGVQANPDSLLTSSRYRLEWIMIIHGRASPATAVATPRSTGRITSRDVRAGRT